MIFKVKTSPTVPDFRLIHDDIAGRPVPRYSKSGPSCRSPFTSGKDAALVYNHGNGTPKIPDILLAVDLCLELDDALQ